MLLIGLSFGIVEQANGQCTNTTSFGTAAINTSGTVVTITTCAYAGEYSTINGAVAGQTLRFTSSVATDFITIRSGTPGGPVLAFGQTPVEFANTFTGTIYAHWNTDASCGTASSCRTVTVQCTSCTPAPANDLCANAIPIACSTASGTTVGATFDNVGICGTSNTAPGVWYTFTSPGTGNATVSLCGSSFDTKISVFSGTCGSLVCIGGNDDFCGLQSQFTFGATQGTTYYVLVHGYSSETGAFTLSLTCPAPPPPGNDLCANAIPISCGQALSGTTVGAAFDDVGTCVTSNTSPGVWYAFTGTGTPATVSTCGQASFDTKLSVFTGACGALVCVGGNDDFSGCSGFTSQFTFPTTAGTTYYVLVHGFGTATGSFTLSLTCEPLNLDIQISDPCSCDDPLNVQPWGGMVQLFHDVLLVNIGLPGQNVTVSQSFNPANFVDINGDPIPVNTALDDQGDGTYTLSFYRPPSTSFSVEIDVNGIYQEIFNSDTCLDAEACGVLPIPTMSEWGLIILALLMLQGIWLTLVFKPTNIPKDIPALWFQGLRAGLQDKNMLFIMIIIAVSVLSFMAFFNIAQSADIVGVPAALFLAIPVVYWHKKLRYSLT
jgi:hypothetical protein